MTTSRKTREILSHKDEIRILHIDDDPAFAELVEVYLEKEDDMFTVTTATDPEAGIRKVDADNVDCVVCDYDMPGMNGLEVLKQVRAISPDLPFILFTGKGSEEIAAEAISAGVTEYLQKNSGTDQYTVLANRIRNAVAKNWTEQQMSLGFKAIDTAYDGISLLGEDGTFLYVNQAYAEVTGYEEEELLGNHWDMLYPDEDVDQVYEKVLPQAHQGKWQGATRLVQSDGDTITVDHTLAGGDDGMLICTVAEINDAEELRHELSLKERAMDEAHIGITIADATSEDEPLIYVNDGFCRLTGYEREEVIGRNCRFLQGENTADEPVAAMREAIDHREPVVVELRNYRKDGSEFWNHLSISPIKNDNGDVTHFVGFQEDVTDSYE